MLKTNAIIRPKTTAFIGQQQKEKHPTWDLNPQPSD